MHISLHASKKKHSLPPWDAYRHTSSTEMLAQGEDGARTKGHSIRYIQGRSSRATHLCSYREGDRMAKQSLRYKVKEIWRRKY